ncbi:SRPBCC domain-containing protein [Acinetobacter haemolyticus]|uniref:SRPBCC family protein n=1 Tax=Acinetobacter haemolyticus TaxID=29430 RepID=UPI0013735C0E|nr:SRPBCC domain-containing protein [Acinetobacter haemolyticus]NAS05210.1 SRPBCC domain-containing protein [Acinetobacter haemolyticus]
METLVYSIKIHAPQQKVWDVLWTLDSYQAWTKFFSPSSTMQSDWKVDGKTYFLDGEGNGMISTIASIEEPKQLIFKHLGIIQNGQEDIESDEVKSWAGTLEKYFLLESGADTELHVEVDVQPEYIEMMDKGFKQGLEAIKQMSES